MGQICCTLLAILLAPEKELSTSFWADLLGVHFREESIPWEKSEHGGRKCHQEKKHTVRECVKGLNFFAHLCQKWALLGLSSFSMDSPT